MSDSAFSEKLPELPSLLRLIDNHHTSLFFRRFPDLTAWWLSCGMGKLISSTDFSDLFQYVIFDKSFRDKTMVYAVVRGPNVLSSEQVAKLESWLPPSPSEKEVKLQIRFVQTVTITPEGVLLNNNTDDEKPIKSRMAQ